MSWLMWLSLASASPQLETFEGANQAFEQADYPAAVAGYSTLIEDGVATGPVLYNLGNSYLQAGDLGHAIAAYRGAQMYWPRHKALSDNLSFARNSSKAMAAPVEVYPILRWLLPWRYLLSPSELRWLFVLINACFWSAAWANVLRPSCTKRRGLLLSLAVPFVLIGSTVALREMVPTRIGVVLVESTKAYPEASAATPVSFVVREGTELWWGKTEDEWAWIELSDGRAGWIQTADVALLRL